MSSFFQNDWKCVDFCENLWFTENLIKFLKKAINLKNSNLNDFLMNATNKTKFQNYWKIQDWKKTNLKIYIIYRLID
jgi:hypothetical protein